MTDFALRLTTLLAENPRLTPNGCNPMGDVDDERWEQYRNDYIERQRKLCAFITEHLPTPTTSGGWLRVGSYGLKHLLENQNWTQEENTYISNGECIVAMMMCGYKAHWSKDRTSPNCEFSVKAKYYKALCLTRRDRF